MNHILDKILTVDPNNSEAVKETITLFFQNLLKHDGKDCNRWLRALGDILCRFPKYCIAHRNTIETYLILFLDSERYHDVIESAKCAHSLQQVRPSHEKTSTPKSCWRDQMLLLCDAAHKLFSAIYPSTVDVYKTNTQNTMQASNSSPLANALTSTNVQNNSNKLKMLQIRLKNIFIYLQAMLVEIYPVAKPIQPQLILDVIVRVVSIARDARHSMGDIAIIKSEALRTLDALVACLGPNLIPYSPLVFRCVMQTLRWSSEHPADTKKVRCDAYSSIRRWLTVLHVHKISNDNRSSLEDELTMHIIKDITPATKLVELTMGAQPTKHMSKKAKRKLATSQLKDSNIASHMPGEKHKLSISDQDDNTVAISALECAESFLLVSGIFLKPETHNVFQERLVRDCYSLDSYDTNHALLLLRVLEACRKSASPIVPPPTQYCLHLYSMLVNSTNNEISSFCSRALLDIRMHLHCSPPSLNYALQPDIEKKTVEKRKKVSERNRAVLESLIGKDKMPYSEPDEIIDISDEPNKKKPRVSEDGDKISLSSDSVCSVEISDSDSEQIVEVNVNAIDKDSSFQVTADVHAVRCNEVSSESELVIDENITAIDEDTESHENDNTRVEEPSKYNENNTEGSNHNDEVETDKIETSNVDIGNTVIEDVQTNKETAIFDAITQIANASYDSIDGEEIPRSLEVVGYDYPNKGTDKAPILDKTDDNENLPSTNDTDDIQITCGQVVKCSQDGDSEKNKSEIITVAKVNGVDILQNGISNSTPDNETPATATKKDVLTVEDMMADFVDEVNE